MTVKYAVDLSSLTSGVSQAKSTIASVSDATTQATAALKQMSGAADMSRTISGVDVAKANLTLLESKVTEARDKLQTLQNAADAGQAVKGIPEAEAQLTLLEAKAQTARSGLQQLEEEERQAGSAALQMATQEEEAATATSNLAERSGGLLSGFKGAVGGIMDFGAKVGQTIFGMQALGQTAIGLGSALLAPNASMEQTRVGFETLLGKGQKTQDFLKQMADFAANTPFEFPEVATAAQHMLAFGFQAKQVIPTLTNIGDAMSAMGKSSASVDHIVGVFGQMHAAGKLNAGDMMQLASEGIPAWQFLADAMHKTIPEVQKLSSQGLIPADTAIKAVSDGMHKMFAGGMAQQAQTFNGLMSTLQDNAGAAMRAFTGPLFEQAKGGLTQLGNLVSSKAFQQFAADMGQKLGQGLTIVGAVLQNPIIPAFIQLGQAVLGTIQFFQQNQVAMDALVAILAGAGIGIMVFAATQIPILIAGLVAWAVAQWAVVVPLLATAAPFILIGVIAAAVIFGIILAVQHWGQITAWLQGMWTAFSAWFMGAMGAVGAFFTGLWAGMQSGLQAAWAFIVNIVQIGAQLLYMAILGPFIAIGQLFVWLYQHNTYFQQLVDSIRSIVSAGVAWLQSAWTTSVNFVSAQWQRLVGFASSIWNSVASAVRSAVAVAVSFLQAQWNTASAWIQAQWSRIAGFAQTAWAAVSRVFSSIWGTYISGPLNGLWNQISGWFSNLAGMAQRSGQNFINMLVSGIQSGAGAIWNAVVGIANTIWKALGFHSPAKEGPASDADRWMPNLVNMLSAGLMAGVPKMQSAALATAQPLRAFAPSGAGTAAIVAASSGGGANGGGGYGTSHTFILEVDGRAFTKQVVGPNLDKEVRLKLGSKGRVA
jgi:tape measure domain-containing protein